MTAVYAQGACDARDALKTCAFVAVAVAVGSEEVCFGLVFMLILAGFS